MAAARSRRSRAKLPPAIVRWLLLVNLAVAGVLGGWYLVQPQTRQAEVRRLVQNAFERDKNVSALDIAWDVWQLYYAGSASGSIASGDKSLVYGGAPQAAAGDVRVLTNRGYVVGYSESLANPLWAAYKMVDLPKIPSAGKRPERFEVDRRTAARISPDAYTGSGYDRGHLAPNYAIATRYGAAAQRETFLMSNIVPQRHSLNAGLWRELEERIATSYPARYGEVWALVGPIFPAQPRMLRDRVAIPEAFFLIVVDENEGGLRTMAFIIPQEIPPHGDPARFLTTIEEVQRRTGLDFLRELEDSAEKQVEQAMASRVW